ncbi:MAG: LPS export ABC transporter periplasmic protein LptC [Candidatus Binatia bacterium]
MRSRLRVLLGAALIATLGVGAWLLGTEMVRQRGTGRGPDLSDVLPGVAQRIQNFHRVKVEQGRKVWEIRAREAQYREGDATVIVRDPLVLLVLEDGRELSLRGASGTVFLDGRELKRVEMDGEIVVQVDDYTLATDRATYEAERDVVVAPGTVRITGTGLELQGQRMEIEVGAQRLHLTAGVHMTLRPKT